MTTRYRCLARRILLPGFRGLCGLLLAGLLLAGCRTVAATDERHLTLIGEGQEIEMGAQSDSEIVQTMGLVPDEDLQAYIQTLGSRIAATTERPDLPWTFRVLDDDAVNAFALPGGYIYVTRGILAHFENEAQLAGVLGHEIAHVTAKHAVIRLSRSMLAEVGLGVVRIVAPELGDLAPLAGAGLQFLFLSYSREDEAEADMLGLRYMQNAGEDPRELIDVMAMLARVSAAREGGTIPEWASSHPLPETRMETIRAETAALADRPYPPVERERYLARLRNLVYGKDPREGYVAEGVFYHPALQFRFDFPPAWQILNQKRAVIGLSPEEQAAIQITLSGQTSLKAAVTALKRQQGLAAGRSTPIHINGLEAVATPIQARTRQGDLAGQVVSLSYDGRIYQIVAYSAQSNWPRYAEAVEDAVTSFAELTDPEALGKRPLRLEIVTIDRSMTLKEFYAQAEPPVPLEEMALLNQMAPDDRLQPGRLIKVVVGE